MNINFDFRRSDDNEYVGKLTNSENNALVKEVKINYISQSKKVHDPELLGKLKEVAGFVSVNPAVLNVGTSFKLTWRGQEIEYKITKSKTPFSLVKFIFNKFLKFSKESSNQNQINIDVRIKSPKIGQTLSPIKYTHSLEAFDKSGGKEQSAFDDPFTHIAEVAFQSWEPKFAFDNRTDQSQWWGTEQVHGGAHGAHRRCDRGSGPRLIPNVRCGTSEG